MATTATSVATVTQISLLTEAEYGCEHLAAILKDGEDRGAKFTIAFLKQIALRTSDPSHCETNGVKPLPSFKRSVAKPEYICVDCSERHSNGDRQIHSEKAKHLFYVDSRTAALFCQECRDFVYDHELEKIRAMASGLPSRIRIGQEKLDSVRAAKLIEHAVLDAYSQAKKDRDTQVKRDKTTTYIFKSLLDKTNKTAKKRKSSEISTNGINGDHAHQNGVNGNGADAVEIEADEAYVRANATKRICQSEGLRGLFNLGQTCYMNVVLQTLLHEPILNAYFLGNGHKYYECAVDGCVLCAMGKAFADFNGCDKKDGITAEQLLYSTWKNYPPLAGNRQQDAHEFYQFLVGGLHAATSVEEDQMKCHCFFCKAFFGKFQSTLTCPMCQHTSPTEQTLLELSLDVQLHSKKQQMNGTLHGSTPTLAKCLQSWVSPEELTMEGYQCQGCHGYPDKLTKQLRIKRLPAMLCMQMKRFEQTESETRKMRGKIDFPLEINMQPYTVATTTAGSSSRSQNEKFVYDLVSAIVHDGVGLNEGHYIAYVKQGDRWCLFNDDKVTLVSEGDVLNADAYLLFYTLRSLSW
ncbi:hypothetical protein BGW36DRAFT_355846 [Talaromyces proteolyticus]|uniref:USP domain-containing protein n=1 Tax=Talaromyces proteolyticus TaxID=1131652 RepID=A0AAD4PYM8_9EURO|nr:uncharacterized protein BGW36DRAFT_355846 [Talaromyces proteolyticus]KAH8701690.1 hypothetical protein BGW36DRAFT_355846 [Talaromyces proteolyticus]